MTSSPTDLPQRVSPGWRLWLVWSVLLAITIVCESSRWISVEARQETLAGWLCGREPNWLPWLPWLLLAPVFVWGSGNLPRPPGLGFCDWWGRSATNEEWDWGGVGCSVVLAGMAYFTTVRMGDQLAGLPPAYHDEYSYLIQAEAFQDGRTWYPVASQFPQLFDQIHVLNEPDLFPPGGRRACRYFPGTGLWLACCRWSDEILTAHQLAQILIVVGLFWIGRELSCNGTGLISGVLGACSPGLIVFSNLTLAHHPTLVGLTLFFWQYLRARRTGSLGSSLSAGLGLAFAMTCRPMTAAGASLFPGLDFGWWWLTGRGEWLLAANAQGLNGWQRTRWAVVLGGPLLLGGVVLCWYNQAVMGSATQSPYQFYTDRYTPRHVYGFNNVIRGEQHLGPQVIDNYDRWAENLTPQLAARNVWVRLISSWRWTWGILPLCGVVLAWLLCPEVRRGSQQWLVWGGIAGLHVAHVPYWFTGIMDWHYVFETAPLWLLLAGHTVHGLGSRPGLTLWLACGVALSIGVNQMTVPPLWPAPVDVAIAELRYPREKYAQFRAEIDRRRGAQEVLVLVTVDPADRSMDYVTNPGKLKGPVLVGRWRNEPVEEIRAAFPHRLLLHFDAKRGRFENF